MQFVLLMKKVTKTNLPVKRFHLNGNNTTFHFNNRVAYTSYYMKVLLKRFHLNGRYSIGFCPQNLVKLECIRIQLNNACSITFSSGVHNRFGL